MFSLFSNIFNDDRIMSVFLFIFSNFKINFSKCKVFNKFTGKRHSDGKLTRKENSGPKPYVFA